MANLDQLPPTGTTLVLAPLQLEEGSGSPLSIMRSFPRTTGEVAQHSGRMG
jgi:hypothetical protein